MAATNLPGANIPYAPFRNPIPVPTSAPGDGVQVCIQVNIDWIPLVAGCCKALLAASTWDSDDENVVATAQQRSQGLLDLLANLESCPMPVAFRVDPDDDRHWEYTTDGGTTWLDGPLTNETAPSDAIITDPTSLLRNTIDLAATGADGLVIKALTTVGVQLQKGGVAAFFQKIPGLGLAADAVIQIAGTDGSTNAIIETILP